MICAPIGSPFGVLPIGATSAGRPGREACVIDVEVLEVALPGGAHRHAAGLLLDECRTAFVFLVWLLKGEEEADAADRVGLPSARRPRRQPP
jgi:hypothetical protein